METIPLTTTRVRFKHTSHLCPCLLPIPGPASAISALRSVRTPPVHLLCKDVHGEIQRSEDDSTNCIHYSVAFGLLLLGFRGQSASSPCFLTAMLGTLHHTLWTGTEGLPRVQVPPCRNDSLCGSKQSRVMISGVGNSLSGPCFPCL